MRDKERGSGYAHSDSRWEELCKRCGECCFEKWIDGDGTIYPTEVACAHLDIVTRECRVYEKRLDMGEGCIRLTPDIVEIVQWLPESCAYVEFVRGTERRGKTRSARRDHGRHRRDARRPRSRGEE